MQVTKLKVVHYETLANFTSAGAVGMEHVILDLRNHFIHTGFPMQSASLYAQAFIRERVIDYATMLAYNDVSLIFAWLFLCGSPLILLLGRPLSQAHGRSG